MKHKKQMIIKYPKRKRGTFWWLSLAVFVISVVVFTIETATSGARLAKLERQEKDLASENAELSTKLVGFSSLSLLEAKSQELGFGSPQKIIYIGREAGFAKLP